MTMCPSGLLGRAFKKERVVVHAYLERAPKEEIEAIEQQVETCGTAIVAISGQEFTLEADQIVFCPMSALIEGGRPTKSRVCRSSKNRA